MAAIQLVSGGAAAVAAAYAVDRWNLPARIPVKNKMMQTGIAVALGVGAIYGGSRLDGIAKGLIVGAGAGVIGGAIISHFKG
jgi:hypothetical protein